MKKLLIAVMVLFLAIISCEDSDQQVPASAHPDYDIVRFYAGTLPVMYQLMEWGILVPSDGNEDSIYLRASDNSISQEN